MRESDSATASPDQHQTQRRSPDQQREPAAVRDLVQIGGEFPTPADYRDPPTTRLRACFSDRLATLLSAPDLRTDEDR
jgi:hypothetical protein